MFLLLVVVGTGRLTLGFRSVGGSFEAARVSFAILTRNFSEMVYVHLRSLVLVIASRHPVEILPSLLSHGISSQPTPQNR